MLLCSSFLSSRENRSFIKSTINAYKYSTAELLFLIERVKKRFRACLRGLLPLITGLISSEAETQQRGLSFIIIFIITVFSSNLSLRDFPGENDPWVTPKLVKMSFGPSE